MTGFAAASYQRGVDFYQIPTTLLSQVDSSVGGKTGVNHPLGKNMVGAFKQPKAVFIDPNTLKTLAKKEFIAGFAEVIKHGVIQDEVYLDYLEANIDSIFSLNEAAVGSVISRSCEIKSSVVAKDETEQGLRAILNYGHTFGHAIETTMGYGEWLHGEAVGAGMVMAADLSQMLGYISESQLNRIRTLIQKAGLPVLPPNSMTIDNFLTAIARDKKVDAGNLKFVLVKNVGDGFISGDVTLAELKLLLSKYCLS
jgi:3-dehydroquinate synthase